MNTKHEDIKIAIPDLVYGLEISYKGKTYNICEPSNAKFMEVIYGIFELAKKAENIAEREK